MSGTGKGEGKGKGDRHSGSACKSKIYHLHGGKVGWGAKANAEVKENDLMEAHAKVNSTTVMVGWWGGWAKGKGESKGKCNGKT